MPPLKTPSCNNYLYKGGSFVFSLMYFILFYGFLHLYSYVDHEVVSFLSLITFLFSCSLCKINGVKANSAIGFLYISFVFFIFGRFISVVLSSFWGGESNSVSSLGELLQVTWMTSFSPSYEHQLSLVLLVNSFLLFFTLGYITPLKNTLITNESSDGKFILSSNELLFFKFLFFSSCVINVISTIKNILITLSGGYLALYQGQGDGRGASSIFLLMYYLAFAVLVTVEKNKNKYLFIYLAMAILSGLTGARGGLVTSFLTLIYIYFLDGNKRIGFVKLLVSGLLCYVLMNIIFQLSVRSEDAISNDNALNVLLNFFYSQGVTLSVVGYISFADFDYPIQALLQSFIPMASRLFSMFVPDAPFYHSSITTFISHSANPSMFFNGAGLGSSIIGELYILVFKNFFVFSLISFIFGFWLKKLELQSNIRGKARVFIISMFPILLFSPRNGFNVLIISGIYILVMMMFSFFVFKYKVQYK